MRVVTRHPSPVTGHRSPVTGPPVTALLCLVAMLSLPTVSFAQAPSLYDWDGPYPFGIDEAEIDGIIDHFYLQDHPNGDPAIDVPVGQRKYLKWQLTGPTFQCWKYAGLCDSYGKQLAGRFYAEYVTLVRSKPPVAQYQVLLDALVQQYAEQADDVNVVTLTTTDWANWGGAFPHFGLTLVPVDPVPMQSTTTETAASGDVSLRLGRALYLFAGHNYARATLDPKDGSNVVVSADFGSWWGYDPSTSSPILKQSSSRVNAGLNSTLVTGPSHNSSFMWNNAAPWYVTKPATGAGHGTTASDDFCLRGAMYNGNTANGSRACATIVYPFWP